MVNKNNLEMKHVYMLSELSVIGLDVVLTFQRLSGLAVGINSASNMCENGP